MLLIAKGRDKEMYWEDPPKSATRGWRRRPDSVLCCHLVAHVDHDARVSFNP